MFTIPSKIEFLCPECTASFELRARQLSEVEKLICPLCGSSFYWLSGVEPRLKAELMQEIKEALREVIEKVEVEVRSEEEAVDETVLRLLLHRIIAG